jgi:hypothetical protein
MFVFLAFSLSDNQKIELDALRALVVTCTALGGVLVGTDVGVNLDVPSIPFAAGALIVITFGIFVVVAARRSKLSMIAFPMALFTLGVLSLSAIAVGRAHLGNWHLQCVIPSVLGLCAAATMLLRTELQRWHSLTHVSIYVLVGIGALVGQVMGFYKNGPSYREYVRSIEVYAESALTEPERPIPYPSTGGWNLDRNMILFLSARDNAFFKPDNQRWRDAARNSPPISPAALVLELPSGPIILQNDAVKTPLSAWPVGIPPPMAPCACRLPGNVRRAHFRRNPKLCNQPREVCAPQARSKTGPSASSRRCCGLLGICARGCGPKCLLELYPPHPPLI